MRHPLLNPFIPRTRRCATSPNFFFTSSTPVDIYGLTTSLITDVTSMQWAIFRRTYFRGLTSIPPFLRFAYTPFTCLLLCVPLALARGWIIRDLPGVFGGLDNNFGCGWGRSGDGQPLWVVRFYSAYLVEEEKWRVCIAWCPFVVFSPLNGLRYRGWILRFLWLFLLFLSCAWWIG